MTVERIKHNGHYVISDIVKGFLFKRVYIGYTRKEAIAMFRDAKREETDRFARRVRSSTVGQ
jgi:hypothetical protein